MTSSVRAKQQCDHRAGTSILYMYVLLSVCLCVFVKLCACVLVVGGGLCLIIPYSLRGSRIHSRSDNEGETSNALKSFLLSSILPVASGCFPFFLAFFQRRSSVPSFALAFLSALCSLFLFCFLIPAPL